MNHKIITDINIKIYKYINFYFYHFKIELKDKKNNFKQKKSKIIFYNFITTRKRLENLIKVSKLHILYKI